MRNCIDEGTLQAWCDGELTADEVASVTAHVHGCSHCAEAARAIEAENLAVSEALANEFAAAIPTERLRQRVETAVSAFHRADLPAVRQSRAREVHGFFAWFRPLAYASIAALVLLAGFLGFVYLNKERTAPVTVQNNPPAKENPAPATPVISEGTQEQPAAVAPSVLRKSKTVRSSKSLSGGQPNEPDARSLLWQERQYGYAIAKLTEAVKIQGPMRPSLRVEYEYNMAVIDNAIATSREAAQKKPNDTQATELMLAAYQSKLDLMNRIANARVVEE
jgi:putative zinc finger protein